ncbi:hypothetical protein AYO20_11557 [Fonsecaea nubica]|uniref:3-hydroxyacyl-CoA dehydrogenase type-2 n=1 Tax=Fonsecaea nubica TaxID=856822 RepID=A0A178BR33_9EURO|nr:hypothetical protein AYO20_11557 [Fonsecaea nubica]OAL20120.1 hypothetical protein AYO20_11557 [Fonsecaea nubica]
MVRIEGRTFVVSGGASGLGLGAVHGIIKSGGSVAILDQNVSAGDLIVKDLTAECCRFYQTDVSSTDSIAAAVSAVKEWTKASGRPLGGVVTAAGIGIPTPAVDQSGQTPLNIQNWDKVFQVNVRGSIDLATQLLVGWAKPMTTTKSEKGSNAPGSGEQQGDTDPDPDHDRGAIIFVSSIVAFEGTSGMSAYAASKGAIIGAVLPLARDLAEYGIRVVSIAPGVFQTPLYARLPEPIQAQNEGAVVFPKRAGEPGKDFAALVKHIFENVYINGTTLRLDAGLRMPWQAA